MRDRPLEVLDLFSGTGSSTQAFEDAGHNVTTIELDPQFDPTYRMDIMDLYADSMEANPPWDFVWASPPCTTFSVASIGTHWAGGHRAYVPKTQAAVDSVKLVEHTQELIDALKPTFYVVENPRGVLRKLDILGEPTTVWYCQYGDERAKPTDLFGNLPPSFNPLTCRNGDPDCGHARAPRGSKTGTQGRRGSVHRSMVPYALSRAMLDAVSNYEALEDVNPEGEQ